MTGPGEATGGTPQQRLAQARRRIDELDDELVRVAAARLAAAHDAGRAKAALGQGLVDFQREHEVRGRIERAARAAGLDPAVAQDLVTRLIVASTSRQEQDRVAAVRHGDGRQAVVVGGAGRMGSWLVRFLRSSGYDAHVLDPRAPREHEAAAGTLRLADLVLVAVPTSVAVRLYDDWARDPPRGVVADACSVKASLVPGMRRLAAAGGRVASFHPMFGPSATVLRDHDVVLCRTGDAAAEAAVRSLFAPTSARLVELTLEEHDRVMADVLSLPHAAAIAVAGTLPGTPPAQGTTSRRLRDVAASVVREDPQVYFELQAGNPHSLPALDRLAASLERVRAAVAAQDAAAFAALLEDGRQGLGVA